MVRQWQVFLDLPLINGCRTVCLSLMIFVAQRSQRPRHIQWFGGAIGIHVPHYRYAGPERTILNLAKAGPNTFLNLFRFPKRRLPFGLGTGSWFMAENWLHVPSDSGWFFCFWMQRRGEHESQEVFSDGQMAPHPPQNCVHRSLFHVTWRLRSCNQNTSR